MENKRIAKKNAYRDAFELEERRAILARQKKYNELKRLYSSGLPQIPNLNTPGFWDRRNSERSDLRDTNPMAYNKYEIVANLLPRKGVILNIGAGSGELEKRVLKRKYDMHWYGIDISPQSIKNLRSNYPKATFVKGAIQKLRVGNTRYNTITILDVLEHISPKDIFNVLKKVRRIMKRDGRLIVSVPMNEGLQNMVKRGINPNAHVRTYTPELIKAELEIAGFGIIRERYLFAFGKFYKLKTFICKYIFKNYRKPNLLILESTLL